MYIVQYSQPCDQNICQNFVFKITFIMVICTYVYIYIYIHFICIMYIWQMHIHIYFCVINTSVKIEPFSSLIMYTIFLIHMSVVFLSCVFYEVNMKCLVFVLTHGMRFIYWIWLFLSRKCFRQFEFVPGPVCMKKQDWFIVN